jgi:signal transduction histidine kinase
MSDQLARARAAEKSFLLSISHELKTPLTAIRGYAEALGDGILSTSRAATVIGVEASRLERLVSDLLELARLNRLRFDVERRPVDLASVARDAVERHAGRAQELGIELAWEAEDGAGALADHDRVLQAVSNLVENALRCTPRGGLVVIRAAPGTISVADTGPGLADEDVPRAFERFFLYRRYGHERPVGTGLGLAIVRELTQAMGGEVEVESSLGVGTTFRIRLAPARAPLPVEADRVGL